MTHIELQPGDANTIRNVLKSAFNPISFETFMRAAAPTVADEVGFSGINLGIGPVAAQVAAEANRQGLLDRLLVKAAAARPFRLDLRALVLHLSRHAGWGHARRFPSAAPTASTAISSLPRSLLFRDAVKRLDTRGNR